MKNILNKITQSVWLRNMFALGLLIVLVIFVFIWARDTYEKYGVPDYVHIELTGPDHASTMKIPGAYIVNFGRFEPFTKNIDSTFYRDRQLSTVTLRVPYSMFPATNGRSPQYSSIDDKLLLTLHGWVERDSNRLRGRFHRELQEGKVSSVSPDFPGFKKYSEIPSPGRLTDPFYLVSDEYVFRCVSKCRYYGVLNELAEYTFSFDRSLFQDFELLNSEVQNLIRRFVIDSSTGENK